MTQEEKLKEAKRLYETANSDQKYVLETLFPELKKSEDERIRKAIHIYLDWLDGRKDYAPKGEYSIKDMLAWLEKQGNANKEYWRGYREGKKEILDKYSELEKQGEKFQYWKPSEEQLEALDYAYNSCPDTERGNYYEGVLGTIIDDLHKLSEKQGEQKSVEWSEEDEYTLGETIQHLEELIRIDKAKHCSVDVQYYQRDIDWLKSLKNRVQPQAPWKPSDE